MCCITKRFTFVESRGSLVRADVSHPANSGVCGRAGLWACKKESKRLKYSPSYQIDILGNSIRCVDPPTSRRRRFRLGCKSFMTFAISVLNAMAQSSVDMGAIYTVRGVVSGTRNDVYRV